MNPDWHHIAQKLDLPYYASVQSRIPTVYPCIFDHSGLPMKFYVNADEWYEDLGTEWDPCRWNYQMDWLERYLIVSRRNFGMGWNAKQDVWQAWVQTSVGDLKHACSDTKRQAFINALAML